MNFTNRDNNTQSSQQTRSNSGNSGVNVAGPLNNALKAGHKRSRDWMKGTFGIMLVSLTIIVLGTVYLLHSNPSEAKYVNGKTMQAVFLQNGQVYFGHIKSVSQKYVDLQNIFYLNNPSSGTNSTSTNTTSLSLVKLGCELHGPADRMIINQAQVLYWENIRADGKVAKAVEQYNQKYPNGQTCDDSNSSNTTTQSAGTTPNATDTTKKQ